MLLKQVKDLDVFDCVHRYVRIRIDAKYRLEETKIRYRRVREHRIVSMRMLLLNKTKMRVSHENEAVYHRHHRRHRVKKLIFDSVVDRVYRLCLVYSHVY